MKIVLNYDTLHKYNLCIGEALVLMEYLYKVDRDLIMDKLISKGYITAPAGKDAFNKVHYFLTNKAADLLNDLLSDDVPEMQGTNTLEELAKKLKELYPKGLKPGTQQYWAEGVALIVKRLKAFIKKYGEHSYEDIIRATEAYIKSFNGDYRYMKTLKYFIWSEKPNRAGESESSSDLLTFIENKDQKPVDNDWTTALI